MLTGWAILVIAIALACYMGWNIGANDVANAMGTSVGSGALTFRRAIVVAGVLEFSGAVLVGSRVTDTIRTKIVHPEMVQSPEVLILGMVCALAAASIWLNLATYKGWPVSTTHSIVGAVAGFGLVAVGTSAINWGKLLQVVLSWVVSPITGGLLAAGIFVVIRQFIINAKDPMRGLVRVAPLLVAVLGWTLTLSMVFKGLKSLDLHLGFGQATVLGLGVGAVAAVVTWALVRVHVRRSATETRRQQYRTIESTFGVMQIITAGYVAFSHGANDVANSVGPLAAVVSVARQGLSGLQVGVPIWILLLGGGTIVVGLATYGYKVMRTVGEKITHITPSRGFAAEFGAATTILVGSKLGLPLSTTHTLVGSVIGVGMVHGFAALDMRVIRGIANSWIITVPFTGALCAILFIVGRLILI